MTSTSQPISSDILSIIESGTFESLKSCTESNPKAHLLLNSKYKKAGEKFMGVPLHGATPLMIAGMRGELNMVKFLCENCGADPNVTDEAGETALSLATLKNQFAVVKYLIEMRKAEPAHKNKLGQDCLTLAAKHGFLEEAHYFLDEGLCDGTQVDHHGWSPLHFAASNGHVGIVESCLSRAHPSKPLDVNLRTNAGDTALILAARNMHDEVVKFLVNWKIEDIDIEATNVRGEGAISEALSNDDQKMADFLKRSIEEQKALKGDNSSQLKQKLGARTIRVVQSMSRWMMKNLNALFARLFK
eukprot:CAMPEP_0117443764 /NCGR_PEP_ID=MMETSP0759-20121206/4873_1 /TAXON_ID=63605 /ORGANISM="Percolomonas cosmopolitus, Strain WS" /LENGTH=301 /DNA_ID=CAMNT_0005235769 /DNA_START=2 /DNA_END=907 /DNA_ORIENTATION=+